MIKELAKLLPEFLVVNHMHCFLHIVNLVVKSLIQQFDLQKKIANEELGNTNCKLYNVAENLNLEDTKAMVAHGDEQRKDKDDKDDLEGWVDEQDKLMAEECKQLHAQPYHPFSYIKPSE